MHKVVRINVVGRDRLEDEISTTQYYTNEFNSIKDPYKRKLCYHYLKKLNENLYDVLMRCEEK